MVKLDAADAADALRAAIAAGRDVLITGRHGVGKSALCNDVFRVVGAHVVQWDPVTTSMRVPELVGLRMACARAQAAVVVFADDVDVAVRTSKGGGAALVHAMNGRDAARDAAAAGTVSSSLVMTAHTPTGDRAMVAVSKAAHLHIELTTGGVPEGTIIRKAKDDYEEEDEWEAGVVGGCMSGWGGGGGGDGWDAASSAALSATQVARGLDAGSSLARARAALDAALMEWSGRDAYDDRLTHVAVEFDRLALALK